MIIEGDFVLGKIDEILDNQVKVKLDIDITEQPNLVGLHIIFDDGTDRKKVAEIVNADKVYLYANLVGEINGDTFIPAAEWAGGGDPTRERRIYRGADSGAVACVPCPLAPARQPCRRRRPPFRLADSLGARPCVRQGTPRHRTGGHPH